MGGAEPETAPYTFAHALFLLSSHPSPTYPSSTLFPKAVSSRNCMLNTQL